MASVALYVYVCEPVSTKSEHIHEHSRAWRLLRVSRCLLLPLAMLPRRIRLKRPAGAAFWQGPEPVAPAAAQPLAEVAQDMAQAAPQPKLRACYSINYSHTGLASRRQPGSFTREAFGVLLKQRHKEAFSLRARPGLPPNRVVKFMVWRELHADRNIHLYGMILCERPYGTFELQKILREKDQVYVSFGSDHMYFWTGVVYGSVPTVHKAAEEIDPRPYHSAGKTCREELADMPKGARLTDKERVRNFLGLGPPAGRAKCDRLSSEELAVIIRDHGFRDKEQLLTAARSRKDEMPLLYDTVLKLGSKRTDEFLSWVWELEGDILEPPVDRLAKLAYIAEHGSCTCGGRWAPAADRLLAHQCIDSVAFRNTVVRALRLGRMKSINVLIVGEPDSGKSFILKPLGKMFKSFIRRGQNEGFPLQGLHGSEICLLQDVRYESFGLPWDDWLAWGESEDIMVKLPRNNFVASKLYNGTAPLFATMSDLFSYPAAEARRTGRSIARENVQFASRWKVIRYCRSIPEEHRDPTLNPCVRCAAQWYCAVLSGGSPQVDVPGHVVDEPAVHENGPQVDVPGRAADEPTVRENIDAAAVPGADVLWSRLAQLMEWHAQNRLSETQFENAKQQLGL